MPFDIIALLSAMIGAPALMGLIGHFMTGALARGNGFAVL
jgi:hypothetical protein